MHRDGYNMSPNESGKYKIVYKHEDDDEEASPNTRKLSSKIASQRRRT